MSEDNPLQGFKDLLESARDTLGLMVPVTLKHAQAWGAEPEPGQFTIYCPSYVSADEQVLLHYLAHAKMLEDGWKQPAFTVNDDDQFFLANRAADAFTDFWAYHHVADIFGADHLIQHLDWITGTEPTEIVTFLTDQSNHREKSWIANYTFVFALDWFAKGPVLVEPYDGERARRLDDVYRALKKELFEAYWEQEWFDRIIAIQDQYRDLYETHRTYQNLIGQQQETAFRAYYSAAWPENPPCELAGFHDSFAD